MEGDGCDKTKILMMKWEVDKNWRDQQRTRRKKLNWERGGLGEEIKGWKHEDDKKEKRNGQKWGTLVERGSKDD